MADMPVPPNQKYICIPCGYVYDPEEGDSDSGIPPGVSFADLPEDWCCPVCGVTKDMFEIYED
jgi:rubredoxin